MNPDPPPIRRRIHAGDEDSSEYNHKYETWHYRFVLSWARIIMVAWIALGTVVIAFLVASLAVIEWKHRDLEQRLLLLAPIVASICGIFVSFLATISLYASTVIAVEACRDLRDIRNKTETRKNRA